MITKVWDRLMKSRVMEYFQANNREKLMATCTHKKKKKGEAGATKNSGKAGSCQERAMHTEPTVLNRGMQTVPTHSGPGGKELRQEYLGPLVLLLVHLTSHTQSEARKKRNHPIDVM